MATYTLTLTEEQAEIVGYALTKMRRAEMDRASAAAGWNSLTAQGCRERARRIEEVRELLDTCPVTEPEAA